VEVPSPSEIREWSQVDFGTLGFGEDPDLQRLIDRSAAWFAQITGRTIDATFPAELEQLCDAAMQRMVEIAAHYQQPDIIETVSDFLLLSSFSAGEYSEQRRGLEELRKNQMITPDPLLNTLLRALMTPEKLDEWEAYFSDEPVPAFEVTEVDWTDGMRRGPRPSRVKGAVAAETAIDYYSWDVPWA
jgi:hypothetical protein